MAGRPQYVRRLAWSLTGALAAAVLIPAWDWKAQAAPVEEAGTAQSEGRQPGSRSGTKAKQAAFEKSENPESIVGLNHISATWSQVLQDLADGTNSTLVMDIPPPGRFSRHDWHKHTRTTNLKLPTLP